MFQICDSSKKQCLNQTQSEYCTHKIGVRGISAQNPEEVLSKMVKITGMEKGDFYILNTEVTCGLYYKVMEIEDIKKEDSCYPIQWVSCVDAINFCNKLSELCRFEPVYRRLPGRGDHLQYADPGHWPGRTGRHPWPGSDSNAGAPASGDSAGGKAGL